MGSAPGGVANLAVATSRLGLRTGLAASFGDDVYGDFLWQTLESQEGVDLSLSRRIDGWHSPVTVSLAVDRDRAMVTHAHESPFKDAEMIIDPPPAAAGVLHLTGEDLPWAARARAAGTLLFGDVGWDATDSWSPDVLRQVSELDAFLPNNVEAMAYTRTDDPRLAMMTLADDVPLVVITCGAQGAIGLDANTAEEEWVPALPVTAVDPTGAGDVFLAAFVLGTLRAGRCGSACRSRTCAPGCRSSRSGDRSRRPDGATWPTGSPAFRPGRRPVLGRQRYSPAHTGTWLMCCLTDLPGKCAGPPPRSPGPRTPDLRVRPTPGDGGNTKRCGWAF